METEYSRRVYQGVRVKHTVKDLLAEKRSRQTSGPRYNGAGSQQSFVPMQGPHMLPSYYSMRRSFISDSEFPPSGKQFSTDIYTSSLGGKPLSCDTTAMSGYPFIDGYYPESFGDYRNTALTTGGSTMFTPSALSSLLPPFGTEPSQLLMRESWEPAGSEAVAQVDALSGEGLPPETMPTSLTGTESGSSSQCPSPPRGASMPPPQPYPLYPLDEAHYPGLYQPPSSFPCAPYMTASSDYATKMVPLSTEESENAPPTLSDNSPWAKSDVNSTWSPYELRRTF
ncbi:uncharacterized protein C11orf53 homolog [Clupea harengus]|uniref:Uncharacterized protein C11orf53 homolog n=1 Tax=Clupea harengus TaxID=7950 RepID=A0A6P3VM50_CLUHA|nr:uncharacterized protein C11orf53 homolog [Clupea harengus]